MSAIPKPVPVRDKKRLQFARELGCIVAGRVDRCQGQIEAHHVIGKGQGRMGSKVDDDRTVGLCTWHHKLASRRDKFERDYAILFEYEIERINRLYAG